MRRYEIPSFSGFVSKFMFQIVSKKIFPIFSNFTVELGNQRIFIGFKA